MAIKLPHFSREGPWALIIMFSCFGLKALTVGVAMNIGLYTVEFLKYFDSSSAASVSLIGAINLSAFRLSGPLISIMVGIFGNRLVVIAGGIISSGGVLTLAFAEDVMTLCIVYGLVVGLGFGMCFIPSNVMTGLYFKKYMPFAVSFTEAGTSVGGLIMPFLINFTVDKYTWRGSMFILSGVCLQSVLFGALLRPPLSLKSSRQVQRASNEDDSNNSVELRSNVKTVGYTNEGYELEEHSIERAPTEQSFGNSKTSSVVSDPVSSSIDLNVDNICVIPNPPHPVTRDTGDQQLPPCMWRKTKQFCKTYSKLLHNVRFLVYVISFFLLSFSSGMYTTFLPAFLTRRGILMSYVTLLVSLSFVMEGPGTVIAGVLANTAFSNRPIILHVVAVATWGATFPVYNFVDNHIVFGILIAVIGLGSGMIFSLRPVILISLVGREHLTDAVGIATLMSGLGYLCGPPVGGYLLDVTGTFNAMFYCGFVALCLSAVVMLVPPLREKIVKKRNKGQQ